MAKQFIFAYKTTKQTNMKIQKIAITVDPDTLQPLLQFTGTISPEEIQDELTLRRGTAAYQMWGEQLILGISQMTPDAITQNIIKDMLAKVNKQP